MQEAQVVTICYASPVVAPVLLNCHSRLVLKLKVHNLAAHHPDHAFRLLPGLRRRHLDLGVRAVVQRPRGAKIAVRRSLQFCTGHGGAHGVSVRRGAFRQSEVFCT